MGKMGFVKNTMYNEGGGQFKVKETYLGNMHFLTSVFICPGTKNKLRAIYISKLNFVKWSSTHSSPQALKM